MGMARGNEHQGRVAVVTGGSGAIGAAITERLAKTGAVVHVLDLQPSSVPGGRIVELASMAGRQGGGAVVEAHPNLGKLDDLGNTGLFGISLNAAGWSGGSEIATRLARGTTAAHAAKLRAIVYGAETQGILEAAVKARVDLIGGKALGPAATEPRTAATFPLR